VEKISLCECWDTGQPMRYMSKVARRGAENFTFFVDRAGRRWIRKICLLRTSRAWRPERSSTY